MALLQVNIENLLNDAKFKEYVSLGLIDSIAFRNLKIKSDYKILRESNSKPEAIYKLSKSYCLSFDSINSILFRERNTKIFPELQTFSEIL
jgi:hypothetical protein